MAAGLSYKFQGSAIAVLTGFESGTTAITAITKSVDPVVTSAGSNLAAGEVAFIDNVVGMTEVNGKLFVADPLTANTFGLIDTDTTGYGTYVSGGTVAVGVFSNFCELTSYNRTGGSSPEIDTTSICSTAAEFVLGLPDFGTTQIDYKFAPNTAIQQAIQAAYLDGATIAVKITLPNNGGVMIQMGYVQQTSETASVGGIWTGSMTIRNTGNRIDVEV